MRLILLCLLVLSGCAAPLHSVNGKDVDPPMGYTVYCHENPTRPECSKP